MLLRVAADDAPRAWPYPYEHELPGHDLVRHVFWPFRKAALRRTLGEAVAGRGDHFEKVGPSDRPPLTRANFRARYGVALDDA